VSAQTKPMPKAKPPHQHRWREEPIQDDESSAFNCRCGATMDTYVEQDGVRTEIFEPTLRRRA